MTKEGGIRFSGDEYYKILVDEEGSISLTADVDGEETVYDVTGGAKPERKLLYTNPDTTVQMTTDALFQESEILGYEYLIFTVTSTGGDYEVEEWCEIEPLKAHNGQFVISMPTSNALWARKVYRSSGAVKPSASVYDQGKTTENRDYCIIKKVECVKGVKA